ncbi:hypothetical protein [Paraburkholderia sp. C35]|uniref:DUF7673 family protein n=1 Tax=Paraburkholderia sp. C35 TaxID=2126993 RepID=UPI0013A54F40|nr:hypothetical protein [Paraburkholderia sp. C35]
MNRPSPESGVIARCYPPFVPVASVPHRPAHRAAVRRLVALAAQATPAALIAADCLLAWWHADVFGGFNLLLVERLEPATQRDIALVVELATLDRGHPDDLGVVPDLEAVAAKWHGGHRI